MTCTYRNRVWKHCFSITPEGACAIELENVFRHAAAGRACGPTQSAADADAEPAAAAAADIRIRPGPDHQRDDANDVQERAAARDYRDQHGALGSAGSGDRSE